MNNQPEPPEEIWTDWNRIEPPDKEAYWNLEDYDLEEAFGNDTKYLRADVVPDPELVREIAERLEKTESILWGLLWDWANDIPTEKYLPRVKKEIEEYEKQWDDFDGKHTGRLEGRGECVYKIKQETEELNILEGSCGYYDHEVEVSRWDHCPGCGNRLVIEGESDLEEKQ